MDPLVVALTFGAIFLVELPDKTFIATLVLSTKFRPLLVWIGVGLAFLVQTLIAVLAGHLTTYLPDVLVKSVALVIFLIGAVVLFRSAPGADAEEKEAEEEYAAKATDARTGLKAVTASFLVLFAAEWGDLSQLLTLSLVASGFREVRYGWPMNLRRPKGHKPLDAEGEAQRDRIEALWRECREKYGTGGPFLFGHFTAADAMYAPVVIRFDTHGGTLAPDTRAYVDAVLATPAT